jgi:hypothetical protein
VAISFVGSATGITSATLPAHQAGDLILAFAYRDGSTSAPVLASGFTSLLTQTGTSTSCRVGYVFASNGSTTSGTWTSATSVIFLVYRGVSFIGNSNSTFGTGTIISFPGISSLNSNEQSWIVGFVGHRSTNVSIETAPSGLINRVSVSDGTDEAAAHDTNSGISSFSTVTASIGGSSSGWVSATIELVDGSATAEISGIELLADNLLAQPKPEWYSWYFDERLLSVLTNAEIQLNGQYAITGFSEVDAFGEQSVSIQINGLIENSSINSIFASGTSFVNIEGISKQSSFGSISVTVDDSQSISGVVSLFDFSKPNAITDSFANINSVNAAIVISSVDINANCNIGILGQQETTNFAQVTASNAKNVEIELDGVEVQTQTSEISVSIENPEIWSSGKIQRYPANAFKNSSVKLSGIVAQSSQNDISASGTVQIDATVALNNVVSFSQVANINADGILSISDDEIILLMAA